MTTNYPFFTVQSPEGEKQTIHFQDFFQANSEKKSVTLGRLEHHDIALPDPEKNISRNQCKITLQQDKWHISDEGSSNGTFIRRAGENTEIDVRLSDSVALQENDTILILGKFQDDKPVFWELTFHDPGVTKPHSKFELPADEFEYHLGKKMLYRLQGKNKELVKLTKKEKAMFHHLAQKNWEHEESMSCNYDELIDAIWQDSESFNKNNNDINWLAWSIRRKIETDSGEPRFLLSVRGEGYQLAEVSIR